MKILFKMLFISLYLTSFSFTQQVIEGSGDSKDEPKAMKKKVESYALVQYFLLNASTLELTDSQRKELDNIKKDYLYPMIQKEAAFRISEMKVMDLLKNPDFNTEKVKSAIKMSVNLTLENALTSIDALTAIRHAVGLDNFNKLIGMMNYTPNDFKKNKDPIENDRDLLNEQIHTL